MENKSAESVGKIIENATNGRECFRSSAENNFNESASSLDSSNSERSGWKICKSCLLSDFKDLCPYALNKNMRKQEKWGVTYHKLYVFSSSSGWCQMTNCDMEALSSTRPKKAIHHTVVKQHGKFFRSIHLQSARKKLMKQKRWERNKFYFKTWEESVGILQEGGQNADISAHRKQLEYGQMARSDHFIYLLILMHCSKQTQENLQKWLQTKRWLSQVQVR